MELENFINNIVIPKPPVFDRNLDSIHCEHLFNDYVDKLEKNKYDVVLKFINIWLSKYDIKLKRIIDFKNISQSLLLSNSKYNQYIYEKYSPVLYKYFNISGTYDLYITNDIAIDNSIVLLLRKILDKINYVLLVRERENNYYYTIKRKY